AVSQALDVGDEEVVADELDVSTHGVGQALPALPVVLGHAVLDGNDRVASSPVPVQLDQAGGAERPTLAFQPVLAVLVELAGRRSERDRNPRASRAPGLLDRVDDPPQP